MSKQVRWMRPYARVSEGIAVDAIVGLTIEPYRSRYLPPGVPTITQWQYYLRIDLWLVKIQFTWISREKLVEPTHE